MIPTPHIACQDKNLVARTVLMPGDPLRAKIIAEKFLTDVTQFNSVRNMYGYTGYYNGKRITVMGSGMGMPSIGIYSYELFKFYDVERIIRIGSAGSYTKDLNLYDTVICTKAWSETTYAKVQCANDSEYLESDKALNEEAINAAKKLNIPLTEITVHSSDVFYHDDPDFSWEKVRDEKGCSCVEMESFALFSNAKVLNKQATCLLTISDSFVTSEETTAEERQNSFTNMMKIALELA